MGKIKKIYIPIVDFCSKEFILKNFPRKIQSLCLGTILAVAFLIAPTFAATPTIGKVRYILGEVTVQKKAKSNWNPLRVGLKVRENDIIRTLVESEAGIALSDGSLITIEENTVILFESAVQNQGKTVNIQSGRVFFDVQKQDGKSEFQFKTATATAAIRGTNGFVENGPDGIIVSLESGKMEVTDAQGAKIEVSGGETLVQDKTEGMKKFKTPSSGSKNLAKEISKEKQNGKIDVKALEKRAQDLDKRQSKAADSLSKANPCEFNSLPEKTNQTSVRISGKCKAGVELQINGIAISLENGNFQTLVEWEKEAYGTKRIRAKCKAGEAEILCKEAFLEYVKPSKDDGNAFIRIQKDNPVSMTSSGLHLQGQFFTEDAKAKVTVQLGNAKSENLNTRSANGTFHYTFSATDPKVSGNEKFAFVKLESAKGTLTDSVAVTFPPKIRILGSDAECSFQFSLSGTNGKEVLVEEFVDGIPTAKATFKQDVSNAGFPMLPGTHVYKIFAKDENGNLSEATQSFTCKQ